MVCMIGADNTFFFEEFYYMGVVADPLGPVPDAVAVEVSESVLFLYWRVWLHSGVGPSTPVLHIARLHRMDYWPQMAKRLNRISFFYQDRDDQLKVLIMVIMNRLKR